MYYAKPVEGHKGSYKYHIKSCVDVFQVEINRNREALDKILFNIGQDMADFEEKPIWQSLCMIWESYLLHFRIKCTKK